MTTPYELTTNEFEKPRFVAIIPRWSVMPVCRRQTVGEHVFLVARYCELLITKYGIDVNLGEVLSYALRHDDDEGVIGDIPSGSIPHKPRSEHPNKLVEAIVKCADRLEAYYYVLEEIALGNRFANQLVKQTYIAFEGTKDNMLKIAKIDDPDDQDISF